MPKKPAVSTEHPVNTQTHMAKVSLSELGEFWAHGYDLEGGQLVTVTTHFDAHTRTAIIEYVTQPGPDAKDVQKVTTRRRQPRKPN